MTEPCPTRLDNQPTPSARPWRYGHAASIEGAHWDIYAGEGIDGWLVGMVTTEADAALIVKAVLDLIEQDTPPAASCVDCGGNHPSGHPWHTPPTEGGTGMSEPTTTETCWLCMSEVPAPQRGDHDYGLRLPSRAAIEQEAVADYREALAARVGDELGVYPAASPSGPRTPEQDGYNRAIGEVLALIEQDTPPAAPLDVEVLKVLRRTATMGSCSQTHHEHIARAAAAIAREYEVQP